MIEIKDLLRNMRTAHGWTTTEIAKKAGMAQSTYSRLENGGRVPSVPSVPKLQQLTTYRKTILRLK